MPYSTYLFYLLLLLVAFLYSSVGHGGASGYLALMAFFSFAPETMRSTALLLNIFVSLIAFLQYYRNGFFQWKLFWPFALTSIPAAFLGGLISLDGSLYKKILALLLLFPIIKLLGFNLPSESVLKKINIYSALAIGAAIGLLSGMIGIGGGIILSPLILLLGWATIKQAAAVSALFIFVNSIAGLAGIFTTKVHFNLEISLLIFIAVTGGLLGSYYGSKKLNNLQLKKILAVVLLIASIKLILI